MKMKSLLVAVVNAYVNEDCANLDVEALCSSDCDTAYATCVVECSQDPVCVSGCSRASVQCLTLCPCHEDCFDGCPCEQGSAYCDGFECTDFHADAYEACVHFSQGIFFTCTDECVDFDQECQDQCAELYVSELDKCPCMAACPDGCPCDGYNCVEPDVPYDIELMVFNPRAFKHDKPEFGQLKFYTTWQDGEMFEAYHPHNMIMPDSFDGERALMCQFISHGKMYVAGGDNEKSHR